jgi:hypothetical protein
MYSIALAYLPSYLQKKLENLESIFTYFSLLSLLSMKYINTRTQQIYVYNKQMLVGAMLGWFVWLVSDHLLLKTCWDNIYDCRCLLL